MTPDQFAALRRNLSTTVTASLTGLFRGLGSWRDPDAAQFTDRAVPLVRGAQRTLASLVAYFIATRAGAALDRVVGPPPIPDTATIDLRPGVTPERVYTRPFVTLRWQLSKGADLATAVERGASRLEQLTEGDLQLTYAHASRAALQGLPAAPHGWRRVLHGTENCAMCVVASTQLYGVEELNPLHHHCDCTVEPVYGHPPRVDRQRAAEVLAAIAELTGRWVSDAKTLRGLVVQHGELGAVLVRPKDHHTTPADLPA